MNVAAPQCADSGRGEPSSCLVGQAARTGMRVSKLHAQLVSLLEVVPDKFVELGEAREPVIEVAGEFLVQVSSEPLRRRPVYRVLNKDVPETEAALTAGTNEASPR